MADPEYTIDFSKTGDQAKVSETSRMVIKRVIDVYVASKAAKKDRNATINDMKDKIVAIGPGKVSRHCADSAKLDDIAAVLSELADVALPPRLAQRVCPLIAARAFDPGHAERLDLPPGGDEEFYVASEPVGSVLVLTLRHDRD